MGIGGREQGLPDLRFSQGALLGGSWAVIRRYK